MAPWVAKKGFDLKRCEKHVEQHLKDFPVALDDIPAFAEDRRRSRIWVFIAIVFMAHAGIIDTWQEGQAVMVARHQAGGEGHATFSDGHDVDGVGVPWACD